MKKDKALLVAGLIFAIVAIAHLVRYFYKAEVIISGIIIPMEVSLVAFVVATVLSLWMFKARKE